MRNKFTITEGEVQRILGLHKQVFLKENVQNIKNPDVEAKKQEVLVLLNKLKESNTNQKVKNQIEKSITELNNMSTDSICENNQLKPELAKKLAESKKDLNNYRSFINDPEKLIDKIIINMTFIEEYCQSKNKSSDVVIDDSGLLA